MGDLTKSWLHIGSVGYANVGWQKGLVMFRNTFERSVLCIVFCISVVFDTTAAAVGNPGRRVAIAGGSKGQVTAIVRMAEHLMLRTGDQGRFRAWTWSDYDSISKFADGVCDIYVGNNTLSGMEIGILAVRFPSDKQQPEAFHVGDAKAIAVANRLNPVKQLSIDTIRLLFAGKSKNAKPDGLAESGERKHYYIESYGSIARQIVHRKAMVVRRRGDSYSFRAFRKDLVQCYGPEDIVEKVRKNRDGIGVVLYDPHNAKLMAALKKVKVLAIGETDKGPFIKPTLAPVVQEDYPLSEPLILYLHPKAPPLARKLCEFAVSEEGAKIAAKHGLITPWHESQYRRELRLREMKAGKGGAAITAPIVSGRAKCAT